MTRKISTGVGSLAVRVRGQGPTAVLWHSLFVDERSWGRVEDELATERRVVSVTGPGHGASDDPGRRYTLAECAAAAGTILDELGVDEPVDWIGNAWGGHIGIVFATDAAPRCRTLVTLGTPVRALNRTERARTVFLLAAHRMLGPVGFIRSGVTNVLLSAATRKRDPEAVALVGDCLVRAGRAALRNAVVSISLHRPDLTDRLPGRPVRGARRDDGSGAAILVGVGAGVPVTAFDAVHSPRRITARGHRSRPRAASSRRIRRRPGPRSSSRTNSKPSRR